MRSVHSFSLLLEMHCIEPLVMLKHAIYVIPGGQPTRLSHWLNGLIEVKPKET